MSSFKRCVVCAEGNTVSVLDCGDVPLTNRFPATADAPMEKVPLALSLCESCGLLQLEKTPLAEQVKSVVDWIFYNEPEGHLDDLVEVLVGLPGVSVKSAVAGLTFKDDSTLERLRRRGFKNIWRLNPAADLNVTDPRAGLETIQDRMTPSAAQEIRAKRGGVDVLLVRHIFEHAYRPAEFLRALKALLNPGGRLIFEVPDCARAIAAGDYTMIWEEHTLYFTPLTFQLALANNGFSTVHFKLHPYFFENSLVAIVQVGSGPIFSADSNQVEKEKQAALSYGRAFAAKKEQWQRYLRSVSEKSAVAMFGAGHASAMFLSLFDLSRYVRFVVDDNPNKLGRYVPAGGLEIRGSSALLDEKINLCLTAVSPESGKKIAEKNSEFLQQSGRFQSIFEPVASL